MRKMRRFWRRLVLWLYDHIVSRVPRERMRVPREQIKWVNPGVFYENGTFEFPGVPSYCITPLAFPVDNEG